MKLKKVRIILLSWVIVISLLFSGTAYAQTDEGLPSPGITPDSPFYFVDRFGETLQEFFTFNPEARARLQLTFAAERIAEIKLMLETKGVEAKGLEVAKARIEAHAAKAADIVEKEKQKGKDVSALAGEIVDNFHWQRKAVKQVFEEAKQEFFSKKKILHEQLLAAIKAGDTDEQERIRQELIVIEAEKDAAEAEKDEAIAALETAKDSLQDKLEKEKRKEDEARDALEVAEETKKEAEEYQHELEEKMLEKKAEAEARMLEAKGKEAERIQEQAERELEQIRKEQEKAEEIRKMAEERQREAEEKLREIEREQEEAEEEPEEEEEEELEEEAEE